MNASAKAGQAPEKEAASEVEAPEVDATGEASVGQSQELNGASVNQVEAQGGAAQQAPPAVDPASAEATFKADPEAFLANHVLNLAMTDGLAVRGAARGDGLENADYAKIVEAMDGVDKHWFKLTVNGALAADGASVYTLTPAIEKYLEHYSNEDEPWRTVAGKINEGALADDGPYIESAFMAYHIGKPTVEEDAEAIDPGGPGLQGGARTGNIGSAQVPVEAADDAFTPDFVFTDAMNGCAVTVTPIVAGPEEAASFRAWHFQSATSNFNASVRFRQVGAASDWSGPEEYWHDLPGGNRQMAITNILHRGDEGWKLLTQRNELDSLSLRNWQIKDVKGRDLNVGGPLDQGKVAQIYANLAHVQLTKVEEYLVFARRDFAALEDLDVERADVVIQSGLDYTIEPIEELVQAERAAAEALVGSATPYQDAVAAEAALQTARDAMTANFRNAVQGYRQRVVQEDADKALEQAKWKIRQSSDKIAAHDARASAFHKLAECLDNMWGLVDHVNWSTRALAELTPPEELG